MLDMACDGKIEQELNNEVKYRPEHFQPGNSAIGWKTHVSWNIPFELKIILKFQRALFKCKKFNMKYKTEYKITETLSIHYLLLKTQSFYILQIVKQLVKIFLNYFGENWSRNIKHFLKSVKFLPIVFLCLNGRYFGDWNIAWIAGDIF